MSVCVFVLISIYTSSEQCQREIDEVLGAREHVTYEDRNAMPFIQAVIHEGQRVGDIVPLSMFHTARTDTQLQGYSIPKVAFTIITVRQQMFLYIKGVELIWHIKLA